MSQRIVLQSIIAAGAIIFFAFYRLSGCASNPPASGLPATKMQIGSRQFDIEIANTQEARMTGLMRRDSMPSDHGMIFVFRNEREWSFYMKNTRFPLDLLFVDAAGTIRSIHQLKPYDLTSVSSDVPVKYAIELNQGIAAKVGAKVGDKLTIPKDAQDTKD
ncbi:MAG TPA: DUF192 domain-containing protein [Tepidisphaeraceae bacterium]|jgi:hypothetical protein|nr:DUF192 domain-containing protein [Tepidisphaeraceae bacterium]